MKHVPPWKTHPSLTPERFKALAASITAARSEVVQLHEPSNGDNAWSMGVRAYVRICHKVRNLEKIEDWLTIIEDNCNRFVFAIGGVPFRFYRGDASEKANPRQLRRNIPELYAEQLAFDFIEEKLLFRLVVQTNKVGEAEKITVVQLDRLGQPHNPWVVPIEKDESLAVVTPIRRKRRSVELPPPLRQRRDEGKLLREDTADGGKK